jgi:hypothetical protein
MLLRLYEINPYRIKVGFQEMIEASQKNTIPASASKDFQISRYKQKQLSRY